MSTENSQICLSCGTEYQRIGSHWSRGSCSYPELTREQEQIITGLVMGDGCITNENGKTHPRLIVSMITEEYVEYLNSKLPQYATGVSLKSMENAPGQYQQVYTLNTRTSPAFDKWQAWYDSGSKVFPDDITLTPLVLKNWYVTDGCYNNSGRHNNIRISVSNEYGNGDKLTRYFSNANLPKPNISTGVREKETGNDEFLTLYWGNDESQELFEYMGKPLPGFTYKWPNN